MLPGWRAAHISGGTRPFYLVVFCLGWSYAVSHCLMVSSMYISFFAVLVVFFVCFHGQRGLEVVRWSNRLCVGWCSFLGCVVVFRLLGRIPCTFVLRAYFCSLLWLWSFVFSPRTAP